MPRKTKRPTPSEMVWEVVLTILIVALFLVGSLTYVGFYAKGYTLLQKVVVVLVALIIAITAISILWVVWAGRWGLMRPPHVGETYY